MASSQDRAVATQRVSCNDGLNWFKQPENAALVPALFAIIIPLALDDVPEVITFGSEMGSFLSVLGFSYLGAWIFNLIIVVIPQKKKLYEAISAAWPTLGMIALEGERALADLAYLIEPDNPQYEVSSQGARDLAKRIPVGSIAGPHLYGGEEKALQQLEIRLGVVRENYRSLMPLIPLFEHELIIRLSRFAACNLMRNKITPAEINDETKILDQATKTLVTNNLSGRWGSEIAEYVEASLAVYEYLDGIKKKPGPIGYGLHLVAIDQDLYEMAKESTPPDN